MTRIQVSPVSKTMVEGSIHDCTLTFIISESEVNWFVCSDGSPGKQAGKSHTVLNHILKNATQKKSGVPGIGIVLMKIQLFKRGFILMVFVDREHV